MLSFLCERDVVSQSWNLYTCSHAHPRLRVSISPDDVDFCEKIVSLDDDETRNKFEWPRENLKQTGFVMHL